MVKGGNATFGTISSIGVYSAPATPPIGSSVIVTAGFACDFPPVFSQRNGHPHWVHNLLTIGQFAFFSVSGKILSERPRAPFFPCWQFLRGWGRTLLSGALEDINDASGATTAYSLIGTYTVSADGRGVLKFADSRALPQNLPANFDFVPVNGTQFQITGFDAPREVRDLRGDRKRPGKLFAGQHDVRQCRAFWNLRF